LGPLNVQQVMHNPGLLHLRLPTPLLQPHMPPPSPSSPASASSSSDLCLSSGSAPLALPAAPLVVAKPTATPQPPLRLTRSSPRQLRTLIQGTVVTIGDNLLTNDTAARFPTLRSATGSCSAAISFFSVSH
jgi:hypothetical protein